MIANKNAHTHSADIHEGTFGSYLTDDSWCAYGKNTVAVLSQIEFKKELIGNIQYKIQSTRGLVCAEEVLKFIEERNLGDIVGVWWTARPNALEEAIGRPVNWKDNPTDVLLKFSSNEFLGISLKSTKGSSDITLKNLTMGSMDARLSSNVTQFFKDEQQKMIDKHDLPTAASKRKKFLREEENKYIREETTKFGYNLIIKLRDQFYDELKNKSDDFIRNLIVNDCLHANDDIYPKYIKVTGRGFPDKKCWATIEDPFDNYKIHAIKDESNKISLKKCADTGIAIIAGDVQILKIRLKYESEKLASGIKLSIDPL